MMSACMCFIIHVGLRNPLEIIILYFDSMKKITTWKYKYEFYGTLKLSTIKDKERVKKQIFFMRSVIPQTKRCAVDLKPTFYIIVHFYFLFGNRKLTLKVCSWVFVICTNKITSLHHIKFRWK